MIKEIEILDAKIKKAYNEHDGVEPTIDGIVNLTEYEKSNLKVMWVLKEPYNTGGRRLLNDLNEKRSVGVKKADINKPMFTRMEYITYGLMNDKKYSDMVNIKKENPLEIWQVWKQIAYVNMQKIPAKSTTKTKDIVAAYRKYGSLLVEQINVFKPDVVLFAIGKGPYNKFKNDVQNGHVKLNNQTQFWHVGHPRLSNLKEIEGKFTTEKYVNWAIGKMNREK